MNYDYVIIGLGLSGLVALKELINNNPNSKICVVQKNCVGGNCRSFYDGTNWFDIGGHFFHNIDKLPLDYKYLCKEYQDYDKNVYSRDINDKIYHGMIQDFIKIQKKDKVSFNNLKQYFLGSFGLQICQKFLLPYNKKLNYQSLQNCIVPQIMKTRTPKPKQKNYNNTFKYPSNNGCQKFIDDLFQSISLDNVNIIYDEMNKIDFDNKQVLLTNTKINFRNSCFVSASISKYLNIKTNINVYVTNLYGIPKEQTLKEGCWQYISNSQQSIFRIGNYKICNGKQKNNYLPFYVQSNQLLKQYELKKYFEHYQIVNTCYVDRAYPTTNFYDSKKIQDFIQKSKQNKVFWIGRYGKDKWFSMYETILDTINIIQESLK